MQYSVEISTKYLVTFYLFFLMQKKLKWDYFVGYMCFQWCVYTTGQVCKMASRGTRKERM